MRSARAGQGLYDFDTRILSQWRLTLDGKSPEIVAQATEENDTWQAVLRLAQEGGAAAGPRLPQDALEIEIRREVGPAMREAITLRNWSAEPYHARLVIELDADFADISGAEDDGWRELLKIERRPAADGSGLDFRASAARDGRSFERRLSVSAVSALTMAAADDRLSLDVALGGRGDEATIVLDYVSFVDGAERRFDPEHARRVQQRANWQRRRPALEAPARPSASFERAASDLFALRNWELEERFSGSSNGAAWVLNAGVPAFTGLFGRDVLTSAWQSALMGPRAALGALAAVAATESEIPTTRGAMPSRAR